MPVLLFIGVLACQLQAAETDQGLGSDEVNQVNAWLAAQQDIGILAIGESAHDSPATQKARNQLILDLVRRDLIGLIILESGFVESRTIDSYVRGKELRDLRLASGLTNGFDLFPPNLELIEAVRQVNADRADAGRIRLFGMDLSGGGPWGAAPGMAPIECALEASDPRRREELRQRFQHLIGPGLQGQPVTPAIIAGYDDAVRDLRRSLSVSVPREIDLCATIATHGVQLLTTLPHGMPGSGIPASAWRSIETRDRLMADNVEALLPLANGKLVIIVTHVSHSAISAMEGPRWQHLDKAPESMGMVLRKRFGGRYRSVLVLAEQKEQGCFRKNDASVIMRLPDYPCPVTINGDDTQLLTLSSATDLVVLP